MKKTLALLLAIFMILPLVPIMAFAEGEPTVSMTVGTEGATAHPGDTITVPVVITQNDGFTGFTLGVEYDTTRLEIDSTKGLYTDGGLISGITYAANASYMGQAETAVTGTLFSLNFKVKEDAPVGAASVIVKLIGVGADAFYDDDMAAVTLDLTTHAINVEYETAGLTFNNGSQTNLTYEQVKAEALGSEGAVTLTTPGAGYLFAGWFTGLTIDPTNDYYVIEPTESMTDVVGAEFRPRYDMPPEEGTTYHALWIKAAESTSYVLGVGESNFDVYVNADARTALNAAITACAASGDRVKLLNDVTITQTSTRFTLTNNSNLKIDLNGFSLWNHKDYLFNIDNNRSVAVIDIDSGRVGGTLKAGLTKEENKTLYNGTTPSFKEVFYSTHASTLNIKDTVLDTSKTIQATTANFTRCQFVNANTSAHDAFKANGAFSFDTCKIDLNLGCFNLNSVDPYADPVVYGSYTFSNTEINVSGASTALFQGNKYNPNLEYVFKEGNELIATTTTKLFNNATVKFESLAGTYKIAPTGAVTSGTCNITTPNNEACAIDPDGTIRFGAPYKVTYLDIDGNTFATEDIVPGCKANLTAHTVDYGTAYVHVGWATTQGGTALESYIVTGDVTLYAVRREAGAILPGVGEAPSNDPVCLPNADPTTITNANKLGSLNSLTVDQRDATDEYHVFMKFLADALDSIASLVTNKATFNAVISHPAVEGVAARVDLSVKEDSATINFTGAVEVMIPITRAEGKSYLVYYVPTTGDAVAMPTTIVEQGGKTYAKFTTDHFSTFEVREISHAYTAGLTITETAVRAGGNTVHAVITVSHNSLTMFNAGQIEITFDSNLLTFDPDNSTLPANAKWTVVDDTLTIAFYGASLNMPYTINLAFTTCASVDQDTDATVTLTGAKFADSADALDKDLIDAILDPASDTVTVQIQEFTVNVPTFDEVTGPSTVLKGEDYVLNITKDPHYTYVVNATMGGVAVDVIDNLDGTYTIENVTGAIEFTITKTANQYDVAFNGEAPATNDGNKATHDAPYSFTLPTLNQWVYNYTITIDGEAYTGATANGNVITIPGSDITGAIVVTITKTQTEFNVSMTGPDAAWSDSNGGVLEAGDTITVTLDPKTGFTYTVLATQTNGVELTITQDENVYTISGFTSDITITVTKTLVGTVTVHNYIQLKNGKTMFLVTYANAELSDTDIPQYNDAAMFWSAEYNAYCYLVIDTALTVQTATAAIKQVQTGTKTTIEYSLNVNGSTDTDAADAQFVYNMYTAEYNDFDTVGVIKFLGADLNGDKKIDVSDAVVIINGILGIQETEAN